MPHPESGLHGADLAEHTESLRRLARGLLGDAAAADDLAQDALARALERPPRDARGLRAWLATVARRLAINARRGESRRSAREASAARPEALEGPDAIAERLELAERLAAEVARLREPYRTAIYLRYHEDLAPTEIAQRLGEPLKTVKTRLSRALELLRERLDARGGGRESWSALLVPFAFPRGGAAVAPVAPLAATLTGALAVKKLALAAVALIAVAVCVQVARVLRPVHPRPDADRAAVEPARLPDAVAAALPRDETLTADAAREALEVAPEPALSATGDLLVTIVWGDDGSPAVDVCAEVEVLDGGTPRPDRIHVRTDADGRARFAGLPAGRIGLYPPLRGLEVIAIAAGETTEHRVELRDALEVEGRVVDPEGRPFGGARIREERRNNSGGHGHVLAFSNSDGSFRLRGVDSETTISAAAPGRLPSLAFRPADMPVGPRGTREVVLELGHGGGRLAGRVIDDEGRPVAGARVLAGPSGGGIQDLPSGQRAYRPCPELLFTDMDGLFEVAADLEPYYLPVEVIAAGHPVWFGHADLRQGERAWLEVQLERPARIVGRVLDAQGAFVVGARVSVSREVGAHRAMDRTPVPVAFTDERGAFALDWVPTGEVEVSASLPKDQSAGRDRVQIISEADGQREVELRLDPEPAIRGRVIDGDGQALADWQVYWNSSEWFEMSPMHPGTRSGLTGFCRTGVDGGFVVPNADEVAWDFFFAAPGETPFPPRAERKRVRAEDEELVIVIDGALSMPGEVVVRLVNADGRPPQDVQAALFDEARSRGVFPEYDGESGVARWEINRPGRYAVQVRRGARAVHEGELFELRPGETMDLGTIVLHAPGELVVEISGPQSWGLDKVSVTLATPGTGEELRLVRDDLTFRAQAVAPGRYILRAGHDALFVPEREVEVRPDEVVREALELVPAFPVRVTFEISAAAGEWNQVDWEVQDLSGAKLRSGHVRNWSGLEEARAPGIPWLGLPGGRYTLLAATDAGLRAELALDIEDYATASGPHVLVFRP